MEKEYGPNDGGDGDDCVLITSTPAPGRLPADHSLKTEKSSQLSSENDHELHSMPVANGEASASYHFVEQLSLRDIANRGLILSESHAKSRDNHRSPTRTDNPQIGHQPMSLARAEQDAPPPPTADKEIGEIYIVDDSDEEDPARSITMTSENDFEDTPSVNPSVEGHQLPSDDLAKLIAEKAPELLPKLDTIKDLFQEAYAKQNSARQADRSRHQQPTMSQVRNKRPAVEGSANAPLFGLNQIAPYNGHSGEEANHRINFPGISQSQRSLFDVGGNADSLASRVKLPAVTSNQSSRLRLPSVTSNRIQEEIDYSGLPPTFGLRLPVPARPKIIRRIPNEVLPPVEPNEIESGYSTVSDDDNEGENGNAGKDEDEEEQGEEEDNDMTESDASLKEITAPPLADQSEAGMEPAAKRIRLDAAEPSMGQNPGSAPAPSSPSARRVLINLLDDPDSPSEFYKIQLHEIRARLEDDEEKLPHIKDNDEARDKELQILLLRTDIEKQRLLLRAQLAYEEATDGEEQVVLNLTHPFPTPGSDGRYGVLPRSSTFMLKTLLKLRGELQVLETKLEGNKGEEDNEAPAEKTKRMENLRFFIEKFTGYYNADLEKEEEVRRQRMKLERGGSPAAGGSAAQPSKTSPPIRYPTQAIHDSIKTPPPPDTGVQSPQPAELSSPAALPVPSPQPLVGSDSTPRDKSGRRLPRLPRMGFYRPRPDMMEEDTPSDSDVSMDNVQ